jgi:ribonuclease VapC
MVVDTSALMAILLAEADASLFAEQLRRSMNSVMSSGSLIEAGIVAYKRTGGRDPSALFRLVAEAEIRIEPVSEAHARIAIEAYARFGKGSGHAANLNFGDCFSYALAKAMDRPLLYKGDDFAKTDIRSAL